MKPRSASLLIVIPLVAVACGGTAAEPRSTVRGDAARVAQIVCDGAETVVRTQRVVAQRDGVHLHLVNESESPLAYDVGDDRTGGSGGDAPPGVSSHVVSVAPGRVHIRCYDESRPDSAGAGGATFEVVDPERFWTSSVLDCDGRISITSLVYAAGTPGEHETPIQVARDYLERTGVAADGKLELAGYPDVSPTLVRLVRDRRVVALVSLVRLGRRGTLVEQLDRCETPEE